VIAMLAFAELAPLLVVALLLARGSAARVALPVILGLILLQRTIEDGSIYPAISEQAFYPDVPILRHMQQDTETPFRMVGLHFAFLPDAAALYGLEDARGYEAMTLKRLAETFPIWSLPQPVWFNNVFDKTRPFLSMINVKYAIGNAGEQPDGQWKVVLEDRGSRLLENTRVLPRAFVPRRVRFEPTNEAVLAGMSRATDFGDLAWISAGGAPSREAANGPGRLTTRRNANGYDVEATMEADGWVVVSETAWPGWRAYVDGVRVPTVFANHAFLGIHVPAGTHRLQLVYLPRAFTVGRAISTATVAGVTIFFLLRRRRARTRAAAQGLSRV
jgi:hypothetical protein